MCEGLVNIQLQVVHVWMSRFFLCNTPTLAIPGVLVEPYQDFILKCRFSASTWLMGRLRHLRVRHRGTECQAGRLARSSK